MNAFLFVKCNVDREAPFAVSKTIAIIKHCIHDQDFPDDTYKLPPEPLQAPFLSKLHS